MTKPPFAAIIATGVQATVARSRRDDRCIGDRWSAIEGRDRQLSCPCLLRSGDHALRGRAVAHMDRRAFFSHAWTLARRQGRSARSGHVSSGLFHRDISGAGSLADAQPWQIAFWSIRTRPTRAGIIRPIRFGSGLPSPCISKSCRNRPRWSRRRRQIPIRFSGPDRGLWAHRPGAVGRLP